MKWLDALLDKAIARRLRKSAAPLGGWQPRKVACWTCQITHALPHDVRQALASAEGFFSRHEGHVIDWFEFPGVAGLWVPNADVKRAEQALQTATITSLLGLASSPTAGWQGAEVDNSSLLYLDTALQIVLAFANTAPANSKAAYIFAAGGIQTGKLSNPFSGSEGTLTLVDVTANAQAARQIGIIPYTTQNEVAEGSPMSVASGFVTMPSFWAPGIINHSGAALTTAATNLVNFKGQFATVT